MIKIIEGNLLDAPEDIICHQVNCQGVMGAGLALQIKKKWYTVYEQYKIFCDNLKPERLLGQCYFSYVPGIKIVANLFAQKQYGKGLETDYDALKNAINNAKNFAQISKLKIALPWGIGCGLGGGNWNIVYNIIKEIFTDYDVTIYKLKK